MPTNLPAFFVEGPESPQDAPENEAVNLVKCSGIRKSGAKIRKKHQFAVIYFRGCGITWFFANNRDRNVEFSRLLSNPWAAPTPYKHEVRRNPNPT